MEIKTLEKQKAFRRWHWSYPQKAEEQDLAPYLNDDIKAARFSQRGWLRKSRESLFLSTKTMAIRLEISQAAYSKYEENEENGRISLATLARAAEAMDCEFVYAIRPKNRKFFSVIIWEKLLSISCKHPWLRACDPRKKTEALTAIANQYMNDPEFRRNQGWSQR